MRVLGLLALLVASCGSSEYRVAGAPAAATYVEGLEGGDTGISLGSMRLRPSVCKGVDLRPDYGRLDADAFVEFLKSHGFAAQVVRARADLAYVDVRLGTSAPARFRVAVLDAPGLAGRELHEALLQHGEGAWGLHRANLAVLAPNAPLDDIVVLAANTKLACWGVLTIAGHDDTYVVPGGYAEL
jgi:hypothetical protein